MKAICVLSGGVDSTTLLYHLLDKGWSTKAVSFDYGQRHRKELDFAARICAKLGVEQRTINISEVASLLHGSALTSPDIAVPEGHYTDESMKSTVVPNRNMIFLAVAGGFAVTEKADYLAIAVHGGDHAIYPDCRPEFIEAFEKSLLLGNYHQVRVYAPYLSATKRDIVAEGRRLGVDYQADTWSCYVGGDQPCGRCGTCVEREEALR